MPANNSKYRVLLNKYSQKLKVCMRKNVEVIMQMLTLEEWASERYRSRPPRLGTLQRYARNGLFYPPAQKEGGIWRVREDADLVGNLTSPVINKSDNPKLQRILNDGCPTT